VEVGRGKSMEVLYYLPAPDQFDPSSTPLVFVLHGANRDADRYFSEAMATGDVERLGLFLLVPRLSEELFPKRAGYNFGHWFVEDCARWHERGKSELPDARPIEETAFAALERTFDVARAAVGSQATTYTLFGHSAGAQFAHRFALLYGGVAARSPSSLEAKGAWQQQQMAASSLPPLRASRIVCANAGWYTMPTFSTGPFDPCKVFSFPYGLDLLPPLPSVADGGGGGGIACPTGAGGHGGAEQFARAFVQLPLLVLLGESDTDPAKPSLDLWHSCPGSDAQGPHRLARGHSFFEAGQTAARALGVPFGWQLKTVPGVGHSGGKMLAVALRMLFDPEACGEVDGSALHSLCSADLA